MDKALLARVEKQAWFHRFPRGWPMLLFILGALITAVSVIAIHRSDTQRRQYELDRNITEIASALQRRATENIALLRAGAALFETRDNVTAQEFADFAREVQTDGNLHGSLGMGWARLIPADQVPFFEIDMRREENPDFLVYPRPKDETLAAPVVFIEPMSAVNRRAIGFDMYSESVRRAAMDEAIRMGAPIASGMVHLVQSSTKDNKEPGFLIYMPVYGQTGGSQVKGFVYSPFRADDFLQSATKLAEERDVEIAFYDRESIHENLLARNMIPGATGLTMERRLTIADRNWILRVSDKSSSTLSTLARVTLFFGLVGSLLAMAGGRMITKRAAQDRRVLEYLTREAAIRTSLTRELNHRVKNTLANVLSIAALTRRRSNDIDEFTESLTARIRALSATHDILSQADWKFALLGDVVRSELAPYMEGAETHVDLSGPEIRLAPNDAMSLGLALHELATNAAKYGALSVPDARVRVVWSLQSSDMARVEWKEEGGPEVAEPSRRGFGRDLIEKVVAHELRSEVELEFKPTGVECVLSVPVRSTNEFMLRSREAS